jgi:hypothetical protein
MEALQVTVSHRELERLSNATLGSAMSAELLRKV